MANTKIPAELVAINAIQGTLIADNAITAVHIGQNQVHSVQLAINSVTATQIADGTITSAKIADGTIVTADIADGQITTAKIADSSVTTGKIAAGTIVGGDIANNAILTQHIDDNQITADQIADNAVGLGQMAGLTRGSIIYGDSAGDPAYLAAGTSGHVLTSDGTDISWTADTDLFLASSGGTVTGDLILKSDGGDDVINVVHSGNTVKLVSIGQSSDNSGNGVIQLKRNNGVLHAQIHSHGNTYFNGGNVGIGFASGTPNEALEVKGALGLQASNSTNHWSAYTYTDNTFRLNYNGAGADEFLIKSDGNVGIRNTSPAATLEVGTLTSGSTGNVIINSEGGNPPALQVKSRTNRARINVQDNDTSGYIIAEGSVFSFGFADAVSDNNININSSHDVGIGTDTPIAKLHIQDNTSTAYDATAYQHDLFIEKRNTAGNNQVGSIRFAVTGHDGSTTAEASIGVLQTSNAHSGNLVFGTRHSGTRAERMRITSDGKVGIGTTPTAGKLDIVGGASGVSVRVRGDVGAGAYYYGYMFDGTDVRGTTQTNIFYSGSAIAANTTIAEYAGIRIDQPNTSASGAVVTNNYAIYSSGSAQKSYFAGKVGIGTTTPESNHAKANNLVVGGGGAGGMAVYNGTAEGWYAFSRSNANNTDAYDGGMSYTDRVLRFHTNAGQTRFLIDASGDAQIYGNLGFEDSKLLMFGGGQDARLYFDATTNALMITASNGTANTVNITTNNFQIGGATPLISGTANDSVVINQDGASNVDFRVETDNEQYALFVDASSEIIHFGEGTNSDVQQVIPAGTLAGRRHGYHGGNRTHAGQTFKYCEGTNWTDAIKIDWNNASWGGVCMRITGQYYYTASNNFSIVIGFAGYSAYGSVSYDATSSGVLNWTSAIQLAQTATGETMIRQRAGDSTGDIVYRYEWQIYNRSDQTILIVEQ